MSAYWQLLSLGGPPSEVAAPPIVAYGMPAQVTAKPMPIDLATALRLADANNPAIAIAQARYREALALQDQADLLKIPTLSAGTTYLRHDGNTQNQRAEIFTISRSSLFAGGIASLRV